jgi:hypothetical protein
VTTDDCLVEFIDGESVTTDVPDAGNAIDLSTVTRARRIGGRYYEWHRTIEALGRTKTGRLRTFSERGTIVKQLRNTDVQVITARLQQIELEILRLKQLVADLPFYKQILQELLRKQR